MGFMLLAYAYAKNNILVIAIIKIGPHNNAAFLNLIFNKNYVIIYIEKTKEDSVNDE